MNGFVCYRMPRLLVRGNSGRNPVEFFAALW